LALKAMQQQWNGMVFKIHPYRVLWFQLKSVEDIQSTLDEHLMKT
jgi:hypothetical protein